MSEKEGKKNRFKHKVEVLGAFIAMPMRERHIHKSVNTHPKKQILLLNLQNCSSNSPHTRNVFRKLRCLSTTGMNAGLAQTAQNMKSSHILCNTDLPRE